MTDLDHAKREWQMEGVNAALQWVALRLKWESRVEDNINDLGWEEAMKWLLVPNSPDVHHSALLQRLLSGKEPLPVPPPKSHSYPWYSLIENGYEDLHEAFVYGPSEIFGKKNMMSICQSLWQVVNEIPGGYIIRHDKHNPLFKITRNTIKLRSIGPDAVDGYVTEPGWRLERLEDD